ncbi:MAG TPA: MazG nucleotide pyrophosphohydrolase domain-containing protein, partial [Arthrobacter sp.]|nr:MazG nucleotide pyrophosphohydrolase domain-containing protein [Arthrobacter sp.]
QARQGNPADVGPETEEELGDLLFAVVGSARSRGFDAERALRGAVRRYQAAYEGSTTPS